MQRKWIWSAISQEIVPGQSHASHRGKATTQTLKAGLTTSFNSIEIDHHSQSSLTTSLTVFFKFLGVRRKPIRLFFEIFTRVITLALDWFR